MNNSLEVDFEATFIGAGGGIGGGGAAIINNI
jgi:hypothetical protein